MARTSSRLGQANGAGDAEALFLKQFGGMVIKAFRRKTVSMGRHMVKTISSGKSAQFPAMWKASTEYHTPGTEITGGSIAHNERVIVLDDMLISPLFISKIDELKNHYPTRDEYAFQAGDALAQKLDRNVLAVGLNAARASATVTGGNGGTVITNADADDTADALVSCLFDVAQAMDEKDVPDSDRYAFLKPAQYHLLVESSSKAIHRDFGGSGSIAKGIITEVAGLELIKANNLPVGENVATGPTAYQGDFSTSVALAMHRSAVGTVKLLDINVEMDYELSYLGHLIVAQMATGSGILRPEAAAEIKTA